MAGDIDPDEIIYFVDGSDPDGKFKEGDDLRPKVRRTLGDYLSCLTKEEGNAFPIRPGSNLVKGDNIRPDAPGAEKAFARNSEELARTSDSGQIFQPGISSFIDKGKDGHDALRDVKVSGTNKSGKNTAKRPNDPLVRAVSKALLNNRFNPDEEKTPFVLNGEVSDVVAGEQTQFGVYNPDGVPINLEQLGKVGRSLALNAVGEFIDGDPDSFKVAAGALIPGEAQLAATKLSPQQMYARNAFGAPTKITTEGTVRVGKGGGSYGQLNSFAEPFDGFLPIGMTLLGVILVIALRLVLQLLLLLLGLIVKPNTDKNTVPPHGPFIKGQFGRPDPSNGLIRLRDIGIINTERDFLTSVDVGLDVFFEFSGGDVLRVAQAPGFYTNFVRAIIRSSNTIVNSIADVFSPGSNPLAAAQAALGVVDVLKSSKIIAFLNILAQLGDKALSINELGFNEDASPISIQDRIKDGPAARTAKSRVDNHRLAWRNSAAPSKYLVPDEVITADILNGGGTTANVSRIVAGLGGRVARRAEIQNDRISADVVKDIEDQLEAEYVPFYFHDLRTNEIISFPAFLESLEDQYSTNYESTQAYGRVDPVRTYSNTERTLSLAFTTVATSPEDFDEMWWKINMLVSMLYPQWSQGRQVLGKFGGNDVSFVQPFSQIPTASPMIRLRVGDVVRSNYSKFGLARLFGFGSDKNTIDENASQALKDVEILKRAVTIEKERMMEDPALSAKDGVGYAPGDVAFLMPKFEGYIEPTKASRGLPGIRLASQLTRRLRLSGATKVKITGQPDRGGYGEHAVTYYFVEVLDAQAKEQQGTWLCTHSDLFPSVEDIANSQKALVAGVNAIEDLDPSVLFGNDGFMSPSQNGIVRSFNTTRGRGLAGFITTFNIAEMAQMQWATERYGARAPKYVKINLTFAPVHDIAPGLDHRGFNRAPIYPVGDIARGASGDVYDDTGGEDSFNEAHRQFSKSRTRKP